MSVDVVDIEKKLSELRSSLTPKPFRNELADSLEYLIQFELPKQDEFRLDVVAVPGSDSGSATAIDWSKLDYFAHQLKKMIKTKPHLDMLCSRMSAVNSKSGHHSHTSTCNSSSGHQRNYSNLINDGNYAESDYFALTSLLVRLVFKLIKCRRRHRRPPPPPLQESKSSSHDEMTVKVDEFVSVIIGCLADLSLYEDLRSQLVNDVNVKCLFCIFASEANSDLEDLFKQISKQPTSLSLDLENLKKSWTKMCRFSANLFQDKHLHKLKHLISNEFMPSLNKFIEQLSQQQYQLGQPGEKMDDRTDMNESNIDFYYSIVRFLKYGYELQVYKNQIIKNRILVFICKYVSKLSKHLEIKIEIDAMNKPEKTLANKAKTTTESDIVKAAATTTETEYRIVISKKYQSIVQELVKQYLIVLDIWSQSNSSEFYNQIIEGNAVEYLYWLYTQKPAHLSEPSTASKRPDTPLSTTSSSSSTSASCKEFKYFEFALNLLMKFCHNYDACRSEFGRVGALAYCMSRITVDNSTSVVEAGDEYEKLVDLVCMSCKTASNRIRLRDSGNLPVLVKLQQKLRISSSTSNKNIPIDCQLYNRLLTALCCFVHDESSMQVMFAHGLIDSLMFYVRETVNSAIKEEASTSTEPNDNNNNSTLEKRLESMANTVENRKVSLRKLIFTSQNYDHLGETWHQQQKSKRLKGKKRKSESMASLSSLEQQQAQTKTRRLIETPSPSGCDQTTSTVAATMLMRHSSTSPDLVLESMIARRDSMSLSSPPPLEANATVATAPTVAAAASTAAATTSFSLSPTSSLCMLYSPPFSLSSPPPPPPPVSALATPAAASTYQNVYNMCTATTTARSNSAYYYSPPNNQYSSSPPAIYSPTTCLSDEFVSGGASSPYNTGTSPSSSTQQGGGGGGGAHSSTRIQFSPSIRDLSSDDDENGDDDTEDEEEDLEKTMQEECRQRQDQEDVDNDNEFFSISNRIETSTTVETTVETNVGVVADKDETGSVSSSTATRATSITNIETINRTEACVFYVLSQLSHSGGTTTSSSLSLMSTSSTTHQQQDDTNAAAKNSIIGGHFEQILSGLLEYLKHAKVRNPRALRILNRLTKNANYFRHFVVGLFPYKVKNIFKSSRNKTTATTTTTTSATSRQYHHHHHHHHHHHDVVVVGDNNREAEMNVYLHSNSAFFDASTSFPSFESIEFTLFNNLKSLCISSSDPGYCCLVGMMKQRGTGGSGGNGDDEKLACALVAPFVLRNSKALCYLMVELDGLDLVVDALFGNDSTSNISSKSNNQNEATSSKRNKSIECVRKMLDFVSFRRDLKHVGNLFESSRVRVCNSLTTTEQLNLDDGSRKGLVEFVLVDDDRSVLCVNRSRLAKQSMYFEALLEGPLSMNLKQDANAECSRIELSDMRYDTLLIIFELLSCLPTSTSTTTTTTTTKTTLSLSQCDHKLNMDTFMRLVFACDRLALTDLRQFFALSLATKFMCMSSLGALVKLAWHLDLSQLACACVEFMLGVVFAAADDDDDTLLGNDEIENYIGIFLDEISSRTDDSSLAQFQLSNKTSRPIEYFRNFFKTGLTEIIRNNSWKF